MNSDLQYSNCLLFSTADWDTPYWTNKQHTSVQLSKMGYRILYIESIGLRSPRMDVRDLKRISRRLIRGLMPPKQMLRNVWVLSPLTIPFMQASRLVQKINQQILKSSIRRFMVAHRFHAPLIWTYHPFVASAIEIADRGPIVYHCVDDLSSVPGIDKCNYNSVERQLLEKCNFVFVTSVALKAKCDPYNANVHFFPNVVDIGHFSKAHIGSSQLPDDMTNIPYPRIGYVGALSDFKIDFALILIVVQARTDWNWVFIGAEREGQRCPIVQELRSLKNVHFLGDKPYAELPDYLCRLDVGVIPSLLNEYTKSMFPMKYFEYLAGGVPVVSTPLEFTKTYNDGLLVAENPSGFEVAIEAQIKRGRLSKSESEKMVAENTWEGRQRKMMHIISKSLMI